jgi:hypothetical protein
MLYTFLIEQQTNERPHISVTGVLKPLSIGSITNLIKSEPIYVQNKVTYQLARINNLISDIQYQINNPKYEKRRFCIQIKWYNLIDDIIGNINNKIIEDTDDDNIL